MATMRGHKPVGKLRLWWRVHFSKRRHVRILEDLLDQIERGEK
jgi:hypothetical protein